jgi:hypothetical protein
MQDEKEIKISDSFPPPEDKEYWHSRTPRERLENVERLRRIKYGEAAAKEIVKSVFEVIKINRK